jgi:DNA-directed RNA polymerase subunit RPC12/RpoP
MSGQKCVRCQKTAYARRLTSTTALECILTFVFIFSYPLESVQVNENRWHKICFKCVTCKVQLNVKTFFYREGGAYCEKCGSARFVRPPSSFFAPPPANAGSSFFVR